MWVKLDRVFVRVTYGAAHLVTEVSAVGDSVTLAAAMDTGAIVTLELIWLTSRTTYKIRPVS